jgi:succinyl-CoA synthetase alpha subunit
MAILLDQKSCIVIQGITGSEGSFHTRESLKLGTKVVAGVTPGKGGTHLDGIPVYDRVIDAVERAGATVSGIYTPAPFAPDAIFEAIEAGIGLIVCLTEGLPVLEMIKIKQALKGSGSRMIGPNCPGITTPARARSASCPTSSTEREMWASYRGAGPSPTR